MVNKNMSIYPVLLAGGSGTRLWPVSRELFPKQLVSFLGDEPLIQTTIKRLSPVFEEDKIRVVCGRKHSYEIMRDMEAMGIKADGKIIDEPCGRNTAPAILLAVLEILKNEDDAIIFIFPADHLIRDIAAYHEKVNATLSLALDGHIVTFGIQPSYPETGYGYIEASNLQVSQGYRIKRFVEKPDQETAERYLKAGNFYWNSGMFAFMASVALEEFRKFKPEMVDLLQSIITTKKKLKFEDYRRLENTSIDFAIMENTKKGVVLPSDFGWNDIGSWKSLYDFMPKNGDGNVVLSGDVILQNTKNCFVMGKKRLIAVNNLEDVAIVVTPDAVFVSDMETSRDVKNIVTTLKEKGRKEYQEHTTVNTSWGYRQILEDTDSLKIRKIVIYPGTAIPDPIKEEFSKQLMVVTGRAKLAIGGTVSFLKQNQSIGIPAKRRHRLANPDEGELCLIEVIKAE